MHIRRSYSTLLLWQGEATTICLESKTMQGTNLHSRQTKHMQTMSIMHKLKKMLNMLASRAIICPNLPRMSGQHLEETESTMMPMSPQKHSAQWLAMDHNIKTSSAHRYVTRRLATMDMNCYQCTWLILEYS